MNNFKKLVVENSKLGIPEHIKNTILKLELDLSDVEVTDNDIAIWIDGLTKKELQILLKNKSFKGIDSDGFDNTINIVFKNQ